MDSCLCLAIKNEMFHAVDLWDKVYQFLTFAQKGVWPALQGVAICALLIKSNMVNFLAEGQTTQKTKINGGLMLQRRALLG